MRKRNAIALLGLACFASAGLAQDFGRRAVLVGGGDPYRGKCVVEVEVDGAAEISIRGDGGDIRTLKGSPAQWRRFECTASMPRDPREFRFAGIDGRGRQQLVRPAADGAPAVIRIEDPQGGTGRYKFEIYWFSGGGGGRDVRPRFVADDAVRVCREAITREAADRFRSRRVEFRRISVDEAPGRTEWVVGIIDVRRFDGRGDDRGEPFKFSCSVDYRSGQIRSTQIDPIDEGFGRPREVVGPSPATRAVRVCEDRVLSRLSDEGWRRVEIRSIRVDDQPGRNDWVVGRAVGERRDGLRELEFSCNVDLRDGDVRSVDVRPVGERR